MAIWTFTSSIELQCHDNDRRVGDGSITINKELANPVKWANCYYCSGCQFAAAVTVLLYQQAGFDVADTLTASMGHRIAEVYYDGDWHVLDGDERGFFLEEDNTTVASFADIKDCPELCDRTHPHGFASSGIVKKRGSYYKHNTKKVTVIDRAGRLSTMAMTLRPGEKFQWRWDHIGRWRHGANTRDPLGELEPYQLANGKMAYEPNLSSSSFPHGTFSYDNIHSVAAAGGAFQLEPIAASTPAYVVYEVNTPYPVVGGHVAGEFFRENPSDVFKIYISVREPDSWLEVWEAASTGSLIEDVNIYDALDPMLTEPIYQYFVKFELQAQSQPNDVFIKEIDIDTDVQFSGTALPSLSVGTNNVVYNDDSAGGAVVKLTHGWNESSATVAPTAPTGAVAPADGARVAVRMLDELKWQGAVDSDGSIADYHVQVSTRQDMLWPVSPNFDRITFSSEPNWSVPCAESWLIPDQTYYWRVRAKDNWGAWSGWSELWTFTVTEKRDGDLNESWMVDINDLKLFCLEWLNDCAVVDCYGADFVGDSNIVNLSDYSFLTEHWSETYPFPDPNLDLVAWYKLDEDSGTTAYDSTDNHYDGTLDGGAVWEPAGGKSAGAVRFQGGSERVEIPITAISVAAGTVCMWVRPEGDQTLQTNKFLFGCYSSGNDNRIQLYIGDNYTVNFVTTLILGLGADQDLQRYIMTLNTDSWYHIALTWNQTDHPNPGDGDYSVYVDCCRAAAAAYETITPLPATADIGNNGQAGPNGGFLGLIDEVRIYDRALSAYEIMQLYERLR